MRHYYTAGEKVYLEEVEEILKTRPAVEDALVFGIDDERCGQKVAAILEFSAAAKDAIEAVLAHARTKPAGYKPPRATHVVEKVPPTAVGKADYAAANSLFTARNDGNS